MAGLGRREFLKAGLGGFGSLALSGCLKNGQLFSKSGGKRPNVVFIFIDDMFMEQVGCYGGMDLTPNIDTLARDGMKFDRFYVSSAVCNPSRFNVLAGKYASRSKAQQEKFPVGGPVNIGWEAQVLGEENLLPQIMQQNGYTTGMVGKWMQGINQEVEQLGDVDPEDPEVEKIVKANYKILTDSIKSCGFDYVASAFYSNPWQWWNPAPYLTPMKLRHHNQEWVTKGAIDFIDQNKDRAFFLYMPTTLVHTPGANDSLKGDPRITQAGMLDEPIEGIQPPRETVFERLKEKGHEEVHDNVAPIWVDDGVGAVLKKLDDLDLADNTVVIFASDNGKIAKFSCYDSGARMPMIVRWPGKVTASSVCDKLASNVDIPATIYDICGITSPAAAKMDGQSILPVLLEKKYSRDSLYLEITTERAVVTDDKFKYIAVRYPSEIQAKIDAGERVSHWGTPMPEGTPSFDFFAADHYPAYLDIDQLYDLNTDPKEQINLAKDPKYAKKLAEMKALLKGYCDDLPHTFGEFKTK